MPAVPMPDAETEKVLSDARSQAAGALKGDFPDSMLAPPPELQGHIRSLNISTTQQNPAAQGIPSAPVPPEPTEDAQPVHDITPLEPTAAAVPVKDEEGYGHDLGRSTVAMSKEIGNGLMRAATATARTLGFGAAALAGGAAAEGGAEGGGDMGDAGAATQDHVFNFIRDHVDTAYDHWKVDPNESNAAAQTVGNVVEGVAPIMLGPAAGAAAIGANAAVDAGKAAVDAGDTNTKTAATLALINGLSQTAQMHIGFKDPNIAKQIAKWVGAGDALDTAGKATEVLVRHILNDESYKEALTKVDPLNPQGLAVNSLMQTIFAILHSPKGAKLAAKADPPQLEVKPTAETPPPPGPPPTAVPVTEAPVAPVPDKPSAEPPSDLKAQVAAIGDTRKHVYLSKENVDNLGPDGVKALAGKYIVTKNFDKTGGVLISENHSERSKATALRKANGDDMQATLGKLTGAGEGKSPDQTVVVQGHTPEGAVVKEQMVTPEQVPSAVGVTQAEGHTPVVTTPEAAQVRRAEGVAAEAGPSENAVPVTESVTPAVSVPSSMAPEAPKPLAKGDRHIIKVGGEDVPVVVAGDPVDNKVPVHTLDDEGNLSKDVRNVPTELFKKKEPIGAQPLDMTKSKEDRALERERVAAQRDAEMGVKQEPTPEPVPPRAAAHEGEIARQAAMPEDELAAHRAKMKIEVPASTAAPEVQTVLDRLRTSEAVPVGKKFPASISDRASTIAETARAVKAAAAKPGVDPKIASDAIEVARKVAKLDLKTPEQMEKNQGLSHKMMDAHSRELQRVLENLAHPDKPTFASAPVQVKADKLRAKIAKERAAAAATPKPATISVKLKEKQAEKVKSAIPDVQDETKPKTPNRNEVERIGKALERYSEVGETEVQGAHDNLERILRDVYGEHPASKEFADQILSLAREQRADADESRRMGGRRMSETVDDEDFKGHNYDPSEHDYNPEDAYDDPHNSIEERQKIAGSSPIGRLHHALNGAGFWKHWGDIRDKGTFGSTHNVLDYLLNTIKNAKGLDRMAMGELAPLLQKLRDHVPDLPIRPVEEIIHPETGAYMGGAGLFHARSNSIQVRINKLSSVTDHASFSQTHALIHEIVHGATSYELHTNPEGRFAKDVAALLTEARSRASMMGGDGIHYGLHDAHEFIAEAVTNPVFQKFLADSERVNPNYQGRFKLTTFEKFVGAIGRLLGFKGDPKLLRDAISAFEQGVHAQDRNARQAFGHIPAGETSQRIVDKMEPGIRQRLRDQDMEENPEIMPGLDHALDQLHSLQDPPPDLQHEKEFRGIAGNFGTDTAKLFRRAVRSGAVETIRRTVRSLTPYDGLVRAALRRGVFGHDEPSNPLRHYDELIQQRNAIINRMAHSAEKIVNLGAKLSTKDNRGLGAFQSDIGNLGIHIEKPLVDQPSKFLADPKHVQKWADIQARWKNLNDQQKDVYRAERDWNDNAIRQNRRAGVDVAIDSFTDKDISKAQRQLLYSVTKPHEFDSLIGKDKEIDVGDRNDKLAEALKDLSSTSEIEGDYFHKGRYGEHVVSISPEGIKHFADQRAAEVYAEKIRALSPKSKAKVEFLGGKWTVDYKAEYVSMHESPAEADKEVEQLRAQGHDVGSVTQKVLSEKNAPISSGMQNIIAEASRKLGTDDASQDLKESLRQSFVSLMAARSAYAGSKLARRNVGGVKPEDMRRSFATHAQSLAWNTGHMATVFKVGEALGTLRNAAKDDTQRQGIASQRGRVYDEVQRRLRQETEQYGSHAPLNAAIAKLGFLNYMTSVSHALVYLTQNFTTSMPKAAAKFGYGKAAKTFFDAMHMVSGPAFRETYRAALGQNGHNVDSIQAAMIAAVAKHPRFGKWAAGGKDSALQQLIDRGIIHTSLSNQLASTAKGGSAFVNRVMEWARILPSMADMFNRISSGVAALELHKGDVYKAGDFVKETHIDYSQANKPRLFRQFNGVPFGNSVTMFKSYVTGMSHLLYSHVYDAVAGNAENDSALGGRGEALKVVAGMMAGATVFAGLQRGAGLEPLRMMLTAYQHLVGDDNEYYSFDNMTRRAVSSLVGKGKTAEVINGGLPRAFGFDMSSRLGLSDLWLHDPPDLLSLDGKGFEKLAYAQLGPAVQGMGDTLQAVSTAMKTGRVDDIAKAVPIKILHNVFDAYATATQGKETRAGAHLTEPSAGAAVSHLVGFRTAEEARLGEKTTTDMEYKDFASSNKYGLVTQYARLAPADRKEFWDKKIAPWNAANPGHRVTVQDVIKQLRTNARTEREAKGLPGRDPVQNKLNDY